MSQEDLLEKRLKAVVLEEAKEHNSPSVKHDSKEDSRSIEVEREVQRRLAQERAKMASDQQMRPEQYSQYGFSEQQPETFDNTKFEEEQKMRKEEQERHARENAEKKEEQQENIAIAEEDKDAQMAQLDEQEKEELAEITPDRSLPLFVVLFANVFTFIGLGIADSVISFFIPAPVVGDIVVFGIMAVIWVIPAIYINSRTAYVAVLQYLVFDLIFGATAGTMANTFIPVVGDALIDFVPEALILLSSLKGASK